MPCLLFPRAKWNEEPLGECGGSFSQAAEPSSCLPTLTSTAQRASHIIQTLRIPLSRQNPLEISESLFWKFSQESETGGFLCYGPGRWSIRRVWLITDLAGQGWCQGAYVPPASADLSLSCPTLLETPCVPCWLQKWGVCCPEEKHLHCAPKSTFCVIMMFQ